MERRAFLLTAGGLAATAQGLYAPTQDDVTAVKDTIRAYYSTYSESDKPRYRALLTDDYVLLENGALLDVEGDLALMPAPDSGYHRTDAFDFRSIKVMGDVAYAVYFLKSDIREPRGARHMEWLESLILRRAAKGWRVALLHSTRIAAPTG